METRYRERAEAKMQQADVLRKLLMDAKSEPADVEKEAS
jgi:hypothetical protein